MYPLINMSLCLSLILTNKNDKSLLIDGHEYYKVPERKEILSKQEYTKFLKNISPTRILQQKNNEIQHKKSIIRKQIIPLYYPIDGIQRRNALLCRDSLIEEQVNKIQQMNEQHEATKRQEEELKRIADQEKEKENAERRRNELAKGYDEYKRTHPFSTFDIEDYIRDRADSGSPCLTIHCPIDAPECQS